MRNPGWLIVSFGRWRYCIRYMGAQHHMIVVHMGMLRWNWYKRFCALLIGEYGPWIPWLECFSADLLPVWVKLLVSSNSLHPSSTRISIRVSARRSKKVPFSIEEEEEAMRHAGDKAGFVAMWVYFLADVFVAVVADFGVAHLIAFFKRPCSKKKKLLLCARPASGCWLVTRPYNNQLNIILPLPIT